MMLDSKQMSNKKQKPIRQFNERVLIRNSISNVSLKNMNRQSSSNTREKN